MQKISTKTKLCCAAAVLSNFNQSIIIFFCYNAKFIQSLLTIHRYHEYTTSIVNRDGRFTLYATIAAAAATTTTTDDYILYLDVLI